MFRAGFERCTGSSTAPPNIWGAQRHHGRGPDGRQASAGAGVELAQEPGHHDPLNIPLFGMSPGDLVEGGKVADPARYYKDVVIQADMNLTF